MTSCRSLLLFVRRNIGCNAAVSRCYSTNVSDANLENNENVKSFEEIPGPTGVYQVPFIGFPLQFEPFGKFSYGRFDKLLASYKELYGDIFKLRMANRWFVYIVDPDEIGKVFRMEGKYPIRPSLPLMTAYYEKRKTPFMTVLQGEEWWKMRTLVQVPMRKTKNINRFIPKLCEVADDFIAQYDGKNTMDGLPKCWLEYSVESAAMLCFDTRLGCIGGKDEQNKQFLELADTFFDILGNSLRQIPWYNWFETPTFKRFVEVLDAINSISTEHLKNALKRLEENEVNSEDANLIMDLLAVPNTDLDVISRNVQDLFLGAAESTALSVSFLMYHLAKNPEVQERLFEEVVDKVPPEGPISVAVIDAIPYLKACVKESFRAIPPVSTGTFRVLTNDIVVKGYSIPRGTLLNLGTSIIGRDERYFPEPDQFKPERWLRINESYNIPRFSQLHFGFGPRNCIGQRFAELEIYVIAAKFIRNYKLSLPSNAETMEYYYKLFAAPKKPFNITIEKRNC